MSMQNLKNIILIVIFAILVFLIGFSLKPKSKSIVDVAQPAVVQPIENKVDKYFPLRKGNFWEYEGTKREQLNAKDIETSNVKKKVEVLGIKETEEGIIVSLDGESDYLIKGNDVYSRESWGDELRFSFPLYVGQKWGDEESLRYRDDDAYVWRVEEKFSRQVLGKNYDECFKISYKSNPDTSFYIFCYGLGIVEYDYKHNGTVSEWNHRLVKTNVD